MMTEPLLTIIACTYGHSIYQLRVFLDSLMIQTDSRWICHLFHDGPAGPNDGFSRLICDEYYETNWYGQYEINDNDDFIETKPKKIWIHSSKERMNQYGHDLRAWGLTEFTNTEFVTFTNADNYYTPRFVELMLKKQAETNADFVFCDILHNYANICFGGPEYSVLDTKIAINHIDIASFICRSNIAKAVGFSSRDFAADWHFIRDYFNAKPNLKAAKVNSCLLVHN